MIANMIADMRPFECGAAANSLVLFGTLKDLTGPEIIKSLGISTTH